MNTVRGRGRERDRVNTKNSIQNNTQSVHHVCSMNTFIQVLLGLTEVLTVLQCSFMRPYSNSQIYSLQNIFPTPPSFYTEPAFLRTGLRTGLRTRPHQSVPTDPVLGFLSRSADVELVSQYCGVGGHHRVHSMSDHEESTLVIILGIGGVVCELSACRSRLTFSFSAVLFPMADVPAIVSGRWDYLLTLFGM